jgi:GxxExxY protein
MFLEPKSCLASIVDLHSQSIKCQTRLLEVFMVCLCHELEKRAVQFRRQGIVPLVYDGITFEEGFRLDVLVGGRIICELKSVEQTLPVHFSQVLTYLKLTGNRLGFLINFNVPVIKHGNKRIIL